MKDGWLLVPLSGHFAFISPTKMVIAGPLLALIPIVFFLVQPTAVSGSPRAGLVGWPT